mmetsp:Transcript_19764/g.56750  ORF Transcript_19764/g.56750 Transcript_19764/m.56750 type:complete len:97 (-) Transcript_19764:131-421(-)
MSCPSLVANTTSQLLTRSLQGRRNAATPQLPATHTDTQRNAHHWSVPSRAVSKQAGSGTTIASFTSHKRKHLRGRERRRAHRADESVNRSCEGTAT